MNKSICRSLVILTFSVFIWINSNSQTITIGSGITKATLNKYSNEKVYSTPIFLGFDCNNIGKFNVSSNLGYQKKGLKNQDFIKKVGYLIINSSIQYNFLNKQFHPFLGAGGYVDFCIDESDYTEPYANQEISFHNVTYGAVLNVGAKQSFSKILVKVQLETYYSFVGIADVGGRSTLSLISNLLFSLGYRF